MYREHYFEVTPKCVMHNERCSDTPMRKFAEKVADASEQMHENTYSRGWGVGGRLFVG